MAAVLATPQPAEQAFRDLGKAMPGLTETGSDDLWPHLGVVLVAGSLIFAGWRSVVGARSSLVEVILVYRALTVLAWKA